MQEHDLLATSWTWAGDEPIADRVRAVGDAGFAGLSLSLDDLHEVRATTGFAALRRVLDRRDRLGPARSPRPLVVARRPDDRRRRRPRGRARGRGDPERVAGRGARRPGRRPDLAGVDDRGLDRARHAGRAGRRAARARTGAVVEPPDDRTGVAVRRGGRAPERRPAPRRHAHAAGRLDARVRRPGRLPGRARRGGAERRPAAHPVRSDPGGGVAERPHLPGAGAWDLPGLVRVVRDLGFDEPWGVEVRTAAHRAMPLADALRTAAAATRAVLDAADAFGQPAAPAMPTTPAPTSAVDFEPTVPPRSVLPRRRHDSDTGAPA